jgi:3-deoxy-D-manno-octulosonic-acid transferase
MYSPLDFWPIMHRAYEAIRPRKILLVEAEIWPNMVAEAQAREIPVALVNARLSPRSEKRFRTFRNFVAPTFRLLDLVCVQNADDVEKWKGLGVDEAKIKSLGSIKYDPEETRIDPKLAPAVLAGFGLENRTVILGGSTHSGEEKILGEVFRALRRDFVDLLLVIAPRHTERTSAVLGEMKEMGFQVALRSQPAAVDPFLNCLLIDTTGELPHWYATATLVFVGKSLLARGGQNPAEAILAGKPVLFGPHMENFGALANSLIAQSGAVQIDSATDLRRAMAHLLANPEEREKMVINAREILETHRGATARTAAFVVNLIKAA